MDDIPKNKNTLEERLRFRKEEFWLNNFTYLYRNGNYVKFFPTYHTTRNEQLNAVTRFSIYLIVLILAFGKNKQWLYIPITLIALTIIFYNIHQIDRFGKQKELAKILNIRQRKRNDIMRETLKEFRHDGEIDPNLDIDDKEDKKPYGLEAAYIDSDGNFIYGDKQLPSKYQRNKPESLYTVEELEQYRKDTCRRPSINNPFMNPNITDYDNDIPAACNVEDDEIQDEIKVNYNYSLYQDVDELWERVNSQRQFYTVPNTTVPNNQTEFANWLYKIPQTCKEDQEGCLRYEDLRFKR